jgi:hypothetical protein
MSNRLFRFADLMDDKYQIMSFGVKHRPMSERQRRQLEDQRKRTLEVKELGDEGQESDLLRDAKSDFINFFNVYLSPSDIAYKNNYSVVGNVERVGKNKVLRTLYLFGSVDARNIFKLLEDIFPGADTSGNLEDISLTVLSNRIKSIVDILVDKDKIKSMTTLLRYKFPQDTVTEATGLIADLNDLHRAAAEKLSHIAHTFSIFSKGKEVEMPERHENIPTSELNRVLTNWRLGMYGTTEDTFRFVGINDENDFTIASMPGIRQTLERVISQNRHGMMFPTDGPRLKKLIETYKKEHDTTTNVSVLDQLDDQIEAPQVLDQSFDEKKY